MHLTVVGATERTTARWRGAPCGCAGARRARRLRGPRDLSSLAVRESRERLRGSRARCIWLALALAPLGACGGGDDEAVGDAVRGYLAAVADRDGKRACTLLTRDAQLRTFRTRRAHAGTDHPAQACAAVVASFGPLYGVERVRRVAVSGIAVEGDRAKARADGFEVELEKAEGEWKLARSGLAQDIGDRPPREPG